MNQSNVCAIVVSYNGGLKTVNAVNLLRVCVGRIYLIDNGSDAYSINCLDRLRGADIQIEMLRSNMGVAYALNIGVKMALASNYSWVLTMDQDTLIHPYLIEEYINFLQSHHDSVCMSPLVCIRGESPPCGTENEIPYAITSGNLVKSSIYKEIGFYNEDLFIDCVDFDFCLRLRRFGHKIYFVPKAIIYHELGDEHGHKGMLSKFYSKHSPLRRYYMFRNMVYMVFTYWKVFPLFVIKLLVCQLLMFISIIIYEKNSNNSIIFIKKGIVDGLRGFYGKYKED